MSGSYGLHRLGLSSGRQVRCIGGTIYVAVLVLALCLVVAGPAVASKTVSSFFGNPTTASSVLGGEFNAPRGIAVNDASTVDAADGHVYVVDSTNHRIEEFSPSGQFVRAFGQDVIINAGSPANSNGTGFEICDVTAGNVATDCKAGITTASTGGALSSPQGIAINQATGALYVTDQGFLRVDQFDASGHFLRCFGQDVVSSGPSNAPPVAAKQTLTVDATAGTFTLTFRGQTTGDIAFDAPATGAGSVQNALQALSTVGAGNATVTGGPGNAGGTTPYTVTFAGTLNNATMPLITTGAGSTPLSGGGASASVVHATTGATGFEICVAAAGDVCKAGMSASTAGAFLSTFSGQLAVAPSGAPNVGDVVVADPGNRRVQEYTATGEFVRAFGFDVAAAGPGNTGTTFEVCVAANFDVCKVAAPAGSIVGQFGSSGPTRTAVDTTGAIYTVESASNFRVQKFSPQAGPPPLSPALFASSPGNPLLGTSTTNTPTDISIGSGNNVFVERAYLAGGGTPPATFAERRVLEFSSVGVAVDAHIANAGILYSTAGVGGLAVDAAGNRILITSTGLGSPAVNYQRVYVLSDASPPIATVGLVSGVNSHGATFSGSVTSGGVLAGYHFEYSTNGTDWVAFPPTDFSAGAGSGPTAVSQTITDTLKPNTLYHVRLVVKHSFGPGTSTSLETTFTTASNAPTVGPVASADAGTNGATLTAQIASNNQETNYHFEYGTTTAYGTAIPVPDEAIGGSGNTVKVVQVINGLTPDTQYHYRIVASNPTGTTIGGDHTFLTNAPERTGDCLNSNLRSATAKRLPDCRAYEQVSPVDKNGFDIQVKTDPTSNFGGPVAPNGNGALFYAYGPMADADWGGVGLMSYLARRTAAGWTTKSLTPAPFQISGVLFAGLVIKLTPELDEAIVFASVPLTGEPAGSNNYYFKNTTTGAMSLLFGGPGTRSNTDASKDLSHLVFDTLPVLTADPDQPSSSTRKIYEATNGGLRLVTRQPGSNAPFQTSAWLGEANNTAYSLQGSVSDDGRHIFFTTPQTGATAQIYRRTDGTNTMLVSLSKRTPPEPFSKEKFFRLATPDGNRAFFTTAEQLTNDANTGTDLYRYDFDHDTLVDLSAGTLGNADAGVQGVVDTSNDGNRVYFVATGQVVPGQGVVGQPNLYLWEDDGTAQGVVRFIATLGIGDSTNWSWQYDKTAQATRDGSHLVFRSSANLTGYPPVGTSQIYLYDADHNNGMGELRCVSCDPSGAPPAGSSTTVTLVGSEGGARVSARSISEDGRRIVFSSPNSLLSNDSNGHYDAYMWEDGEVYLLSSGRSADDSFAFGSSADGNDAFFRTREALVPQDNDLVMDLYTAHVDGGFAGQQRAVIPDCSGESCQGEQRAAPRPTGVPSAGNHSSGNERVVANCGRLSREAKRLVVRAKHLRSAARRAKERGHDHDARIKRRRATSVSRRAGRLRLKVRHCQAQANGAHK